MEESEDNLSSEDIRFDDSPSIVKMKPKKRSLVERELETNLTARVTSPITNKDATSTSRYGRARRLKNESESTETTPKSIKSPKLHQSPNKIQSPVYKMHASNSPIRVETPKEYSLENQIETIYNENLSLSRFGSEEKKTLSSSKYPKVYIRKDLIQTKEKDEDILLIKNMFSPTNSKKLNNLELSAEKYVSNKKSLNGYTKTASVVKTLDFDGNKKKKPEKKLSKNELFDLEALCEFQVGDLAWARMGTYPFWPCIITRDPLSGMYVRKKLFGRIERDVLHVTFFGDNGRRGWIVDNMLRKFLGQLEFETARMNFTPEAKKKDPRLYAAHFISEKKTAQWQISVEEAEMLLREPKRLRIDMLNEMLEKSRSLKVTPKQEKSKKITRTNSDVSLSESLYDTLFSEEDFKTKDSERSRSKSRNRSLDVSEVVTACLDNMAAKTGITKIQRQSHMDRWLQKAKSKTPEKSHLKSQAKDKTSTKKKPKETKKTYNFRSSSQESLEDSKLLSHHTEHDYSQKLTDTSSSVILDDVEIESQNTESVTDSLDSASSFGLISNVESLCGKNQIHENEDMILTVVDNEIFISDAGNIGNEICINNADNIESIDCFISDGNNIIELQNGDLLSNVNNDIIECEEHSVDSVASENISNRIEADTHIAYSVNDNCMDTSEMVENNEDQVEYNDENAMINDYVMDDTKMSVDDENDDISDVNSVATEDNNFNNAEQILDTLENEIKEQTVNDIKEQSKVVSKNSEIDNIQEGGKAVGSQDSLLEQNKSDLVKEKSEEKNTNVFKDSKMSGIIENKGDLSRNNDNITDDSISEEGVSTFPIDKTIEETNSQTENTFFEFSTIESHAKKKYGKETITDNPVKEDTTKKLRGFKLSLKKSIEKDNKGKDKKSGNIENPVIPNGHFNYNESNVVDNIRTISPFESMEMNVFEIIPNNLKLDGKRNDEEINTDIFDDTKSVSSEILRKVTVDLSIGKENEIQAIIENNKQEVDLNNKPVVNGFHEEDATSIDTNKSDKISLTSEPTVLNGYHDIDADTNSIDDNEETLAEYQVRLKSRQTEKKEKPDLEKLDRLSEIDLDNMSVKSEDSEVSVGRRKRKDKLIEKKKFLDDPEFIKYLELRQDSVMDEHPELSQEDITNYLYNTWIYEEGFKTEAKKADEIDQSNLVKGLNQEVPAPVRKIRKKIKVDKDKEKEPTVEKEIQPKEKSKRRIIRPYYKEDFSDFDDDIEYYDIFKPKRKEPKLIEEPLGVKSQSQEIKTEDFQTEIQNEIVSEIPAEAEEYASDGFDQVEEYFSQLTAPKPNLFKGLIREKVCEICEKFGNLVKCKTCYGMFHVDCVNKVTEVVEISIPIRGRKKKKRNRGRKGKEGCLDSESQSDEKSQDANVSEELHNMSLENEEDYHITANEEDFESKLSAKMKELLENPESLEYDSCSNDEHDFADINYGECKIVDVKTKKREQIDYSDFKCSNCQKFDIPLCFVCKSPVSPKDKAGHRQKCTVAHCNKYYHMECLDHWPQTQFNGGESRGNKKNEYFEAFSCPRHVCHTCVCDDPRGCKTRFSGDKLARCVRCPATYHTFTKCLPAGSQILSGSHIICPRHYEHRPGKVPCHVNTGWCFICALGGSLICCEYCPTSFHAECLNIKPPEGGYMCEDCETGRLPLYGEMVWVKLGHYRWWPGIILHPSEIPQNILSVKHSPGEFVVRFFGQYDHYWVNRGRVFPFQEGDSGKVSSQKSKIDAAFTMAMEHAQRACEILKQAQPNEEESHDIASSLLPPHYGKLKVNKPCGSLLGKKVDLEEGSLTQCECDPRDVEPCGVYSQCLNRMLLTECGPTCRAGDKCNNRAFEKRLYPKLTPYRTPHRGWGLKTLVDIKAGQFVIEYVGELIDEDEFQRRMRRKHEVRDENFYFLTLDKERVIDAGPKGNFARFMNHSCEPNCETQKWTVLGDIRVGLFALYDIPANSELTFNYNLESAGIEKKRCMCGAKRCSGYIGAKPKQDDQPKKNKLQKRVYRKRKNIEDSPSTSQKPKNRIGRPYKPRELTDIEKDLLIIKNATVSSDSECSGRLSSLDSTKDNRSLKRKKIFDDISPKRIKMEFE